MAFVGKNSHFSLFLLRKIKSCEIERTFVSQIAKFSSNVLFDPVSINQESKIQKRQVLLTKSTKYQFAFPYVFAQHFISSDSHVNTLNTSSEIGKSLDSSTPNTEIHNQVLFTETPISDSSRDVAESITSGVLTDPSPVLGFTEPTLASLGLASNYTPVGWVQQLLEFLHIGGDLPWWICIVGATAVARILMMPIFIKTQRNTAHYANYMPQLQFLQRKFNESKRSGNTMQTAKHAQDILDYMKKYNINPVKNMMWPLSQAPIFISFFLALRSMAKVPVESMKYGGFSWISDLTVPDPYYVMPLLAASTLYVVLRIGAESGIRMENMKLGKYIFAAIPIIVFPISMNFPAAVLFYWCTNNFITLGLVSLVRVQAIRTYFDIPVMKPINIEFEAPKKNFFKSMKEAYQDQKILGAIDQRDKMDEVRFKKAGTGPIPRTYSYDPTKPRPSVAAASAKGRSTSK